MPKTSGSAKRTGSPDTRSEGQKILDLILPFLKANSFDNLTMPQLKQEMTDKFAGVHGDWAPTTEPGFHYGIPELGISMSIPRKLRPALRLLDAKMAYHKVNAASIEIKDLKKYGAESIICVEFRQFLVLHTIRNRIHGDIRKDVYPTYRETASKYTHPLLAAWYALEMVIGTPLPEIITDAVANNPECVSYLGNPPGTTRIL